MGDEENVRLFPGVVMADISPQPGSADAVVELLERFLADAKSGRMRTLFAVGIVGGDTRFGLASDNINTDMQALVTGVEMGALKFKMQALRMMFGEDSRERD